MKNLIKNKELRNRILYTLMMVVFIRIITQISVPGANAEILKNMFADNSPLSLFNTLTGGGLSTMSVFALSIAPYISASIVIQLLTIAIPRLEQLAKDGETGRKKLEKYTQFIAVFLAVIEAIIMSIGFSRQGIIPATWMNIAIASVSLATGSNILIYLGNKITQKGIGNGISVVLLLNIVSRLPRDMIVLYKRFVTDKPIVLAIIAVIAIILVVSLFITYTIVLNDAERPIPVQYSQKMQGRRFVGGESSNIPLKVNTGGVMPVIFVTTIFSGFSFVSALLGEKAPTTLSRIVHVLTPSKWFDIQNMKYTLGVIPFIILMIAFAYFYTEITFNAAEVSNNLKKSGATIPGIRAGSPTEKYLRNVLKYVVFIGAVGLILLSIASYALEGVFNVNVSFLGTSLIIIVSVAMELVNQAKSYIDAADTVTFFR